MNVRICTPFYAVKDLFVLDDTLCNIINDNDLTHKIDPNTGLVDWFEAEGIHFDFEPRHSTRIKDARNSLISDVTDSSIDQKPLDYDLFWMLDTDIVFTLQNIMANINVDVDFIGSPYCTHSDPAISNVCELDEKGAIKYRYPMDFNHGGPKLVGGLPGGFMFVKREVFEKTPYPWFREPMVEWDNCRQETGEDIGFCMAAHKAGFDVLCNFGNPVKHTQRNINFIKENKVEDTITFKFTQAEADLIVNSLGEQPYKFTAKLIASMHAQYQDQQTTEPEKTKPKKEKITK